MIDHAQYKHLLFYDIEVLWHHGLLVFKRSDKSIFAIMHNSFEGLDQIVKNYTLVGHNSRGYDDNIVEAILAGYTEPQQLKRISDDMIVNGNKRYPRFVKSFDTIIHLDRTFVGLKKIEANRGVAIDEFEIDFNIKRKLTDTEYDRLLEYCCRDIDEVIDIFFECKNSIGVDMTVMYEAQKILMKEFGNKYTNLNSGKSQYLAPMFPLYMKWGTPKLPDRYINAIENPIISQHYDEMRRLKRVPTKQDKFKLQTLNIDAYGCNIELSAGGAHGTSNCHRMLYDVEIWDVVSQYPHEMLALNVLGTEYSKKLREIINQRLEYKAQGNYNYQQAWKIVINTIYGLLGAEHCVMYDPKRRLAVALGCQVGIITLSERLYKIGCTLIQINTDGIVIDKNGLDDAVVEKVIHEWEEEFHHKLEKEKFKRMIQKDVNNYIAETEDGSLVTKGAFVVNMKADRFHSNNSLAIIDVMVVNKIMYDKPFCETIKEYLDKPIYFQLIMHASSKYEHIEDDKGNKYGRTLRVFPTKNTPLTLFKMKYNDAGILTPNNFDLPPDNMTIHLDDVSTFDMSTLDLQVYINTAQARYNSFFNIKE